MTTIVSDQPPVAKARGISVEATTAWLTIIEASNFSTLRTGFGSAGERRFAPGVCEVSSALFFANKSGTGRAVSARVLRANGDISILVPAMVVEANDTLQAPINGTFLLNDSTVDGGQGDRLQVLCAANDAVDVTVSWTEGQGEDEDARSAS